jgi:hypothetical protein
MAERLAIGSGVPYAPPLTMRIAMLALVAAMMVSGCRMNIGDGCGSSTDCSVTGERQCDLAQPGGYCTVFSCDPDTCPQGACVEWRFVPSRTAETWCMKTCDDDGWCRNEYWCVFPSEIDQQGEWAADLAPDERSARIIDLNQFKATAKICVALSAEPPPEDVREELRQAAAGDSPEL